MDIRFTEKWQALKTRIQFTYPLRDKTLVARAVKLQCIIRRVWKVPAVIQTYSNHSLAASELMKNNRDNVYCTMLDTLQ